MLRRPAFLVVLAALCVAGSARVLAADSNSIHRHHTCSVVGAWHGLGESGFRWMVTQNPGSDATYGQFTLEWVVIDPTLGGLFPTVVRATDAAGVWRKANRRTHKYTWIAYALDAGGLPVFVARVSGKGSMVDCDHIELAYTMELFGPAQDLSTEPPLFGAVAGSATETRMTLVQVN